MPKTEDEKRAYSRGYNRGRARNYDYAAFAFRLAKQFREQAADLRRVMLGKDNWTNRECQTCDRWTRGQPGNCKWGTCSAKFVAEVGEPMMWAEGGGTFTTHEDFGCCNHLHPKHPFRGSERNVNG